MIQVIPAILCSSSGARLWPLSSSGLPKQFLCLSSLDSLFQQAVKRQAGLGSNTIGVQAPVIVTCEEHRFLASKQLRENGIELGAALLEAFGRNTGASHDIGCYGRG